MICPVCKSTTMGKLDKEYDCQDCGNYFSEGMIDAVASIEKLKTIIHTIGDPVLSCNNAGCVAYESCKADPTPDCYTELIRWAETYTPQPKEDD